MLIEVHPRPVGEHDLRMPAMIAAHALTIPDGALPSIERAVQHPPIGEWGHRSVSLRLARVSSGMEASHSGQSRRVTGWPSCWPFYGRVVGATSSRSQHTQRLSLAIDRKVRGVPTKRLAPVEWPGAGIRVYEHNAVQVLATTSDDHCGACSAYASSEGASKCGVAVRRMA